MAIAETRRSGFANRILIGFRGLSWECPPTSSATYATTYDNMARPSSMRVTMADGSQVIDENLVVQDHVKNATYDLAGRMTGFQVMTTANQVYYPYSGLYGYTFAYSSQTQAYNVNGQLASIGWSGSTISYNYSATQIGRAHV